MSLLKYVERLKRMDDLIRRKATGNAMEFSRKINVSQSQLFAELKEMRELGAPIEFSAATKTYFYSRDCRLILDFVEEGRVIRGGEVTGPSTDSNTSGTTMISPPRQSFWSRMQSLWRTPISPTNN